ncbi:hypothetical protein HDU67_002251, partial [Dinochytrium kinnereticum]
VLEEVDNPFQVDPSPSAPSSDLPLFTGSAPHSVPPNEELLSSVLDSPPALSPPSLDALILARPLDTPLLLSTPPAVAPAPMSGASPLTPSVTSTLPALTPTVISSTPSSDGVTHKIALDECASLFVDGSDPLAVLVFLRDYENVLLKYEDSHLPRSPLRRPQPCLRPNALTCKTFEAFRTVLIQQFASHLTPEYLESLVTKFSWKVTDGAGSAYAKLVDLNNLLPVSNRKSDPELKSILVYGCDSSHWKDTALLHSYNGKAWSDPSIHPLEIASIMGRLHAPTSVREDPQVVASLTRLTSELAAAQRAIRTLQRTGEGRAPKPLFQFATEDLRLEPPQPGSADEYVTLFCRETFDSATAQYGELGYDAPTQSDYINLWAAADARRHQNQPYRSGYPGQHPPTPPRFNQTPRPEGQAPPAPSGTPPDAAREHRPAFGHILYCPYHKGELFSDCPDKLAILDHFKGEDDQPFPPLTQSDSLSQHGTPSVVPPQLLFTVASHFCPDQTTVPYVIASAYNKVVQFDTSTPTVDINSFINNTVPVNVPIDPLIYIPDSDIELTRVLMAISAHRLGAIIFTPPVVSAANLQTLHSLSVSEPIQMRSSFSQLAKYLRDPSQYHAIWRVSGNPDEPKISSFSFDHELVPVNEAPYPHSFFTIRPTSDRSPRIPILKALLRPSALQIIRPNAVPKPVSPQMRQRAASLASLTVPLPHTWQLSPESSPDSPTYELRSSTVMSWITQSATLRSSSKRGPPQFDSHDQIERVLSLPETESSIRSPTDRLVDTIIASR